MSGNAVTTTLRPPPTVASSRQERSRHVAHQDTARRHRDHQRPACLAVRRSHTGADSGTASTARPMGYREYDPATCPCAPHQYSLALGSVPVRLIAIDVLTLHGEPRLGLRYAERYALLQELVVDGRPALPRRSTPGRRSGTRTSPTARGRRREARAGAVPAGGATVGEDEEPSDRQIARERAGAMRRR
jgi:hypothetical protein